MPYIFFVPNITKQDLIQEIARSTGYIQSEIRSVVEEFFDVVANSLLEYQTIELRGFGTFTSKARKARPARNPRTGEEVRLTERHVPTFKYSADIKNKLNRKVPVPARTAIKSLTSF